jgi:26S proteasome regulatory subunit N10
LRISLEEERARQEAESGKGNASSPTKGASDAPMKELTEDEQLAQALQMSIHEGTSSNTQDNDAIMEDILSTLPGVDPNDPRIKDALKNDKSGKK